MSCLRIVIVPGVLLVLSLALGAGALASEDDAIESRVFRVNHRPVAAAAEVVSLILSEDAEIRIKFRRNQNIMVVTDHVSVLDRIGPLLESFDIPPRGVEVAISIIVGTKTEPKTGEAGQRLPSSMYRDIRGVVETLREFTEWKDFDQVGGGVTHAVEGSAVTIDVGEAYRVTFEVGSVADEKVFFNRVWLRRLGRDDTGRETTRTLYETEISVPTGRTLVVGAAQGPDSKEALFLTLLVNAR